MGTWILEHAAVDAFAFHPGFWLLAPGSHTQTHTCTQLGIITYTHN